MNSASSSQVAAINKHEKTIREGLETVQDLKAQIRVNASEFPWKMSVVPTLDSIKENTGHAISSLLNLDMASVEIQEKFKKIWALIDEFPGFYGDCIKSQGIKLGRGKPPWYRKPDPRQHDQKIRWKDSEFIQIQAAATAVSEDTAGFIRQAALDRAQKVMAQQKRAETGKAANCEAAALAALPKESEEVR